MMVCEFGWFVWPKASFIVAWGYVDEWPSAKLKRASSKFVSEGKTALGSSLAYASGSESLGEYAPAQLQNLQAVLAVAIAVLTIGVLGCSSGEEMAQAKPASGDSVVSAAHDDQQPATTNSATTTTTQRKNEPPTELAQSPYKRQERTFEDLLNSPDENPDPHAFGGAEFGHPQHDDARLKQAGFRKIASEQLTVYTDLPLGDVDNFPRVWAAAIEQWKT